MNNKRNTVKVSLYVMPPNACSWESAIPATQEELEEAKSLLKKGEPLTKGFYVPVAGKFTNSHMRPATNKEILGK